VDGIGEIVATLYRRALLIYFWVLTTAMIATCSLMIVVAILDNALHKGWGFPWWSIFILSGLLAVFVPLRRLSRVALKTYW
jgi:hypothetical protein